MDRQPGVEPKRSARAKLLAGSLFLAALAPSDASAQEGPGGLLNPQRDCQTIVACRFSRGGSYRGCISSYSCRVCRFVAARCEIGGGDQRQRCHRIRCTWGA
jgi:hypothetical protein